ncbi:ATP-binding protein [Kribbella koreensis]|uniref:ATP-binding protein n=1 Tax=Kribbella koreensis TaxID=57909 RepID=A0ABP4BDQ5_9ACTN
MINRVHFKRFKQFKDTAIDLRPGVTLLAGGNNSGKSSLLHGLAVWEFCRTATLMERGEEGLLEVATSRQGLGLGDDEFSPVNVPSLKHLWTNLKTQKSTGDADGYTLRVGCEWEDDGVSKVLTFGLALANDRLFIKTVESNLISGDAVPTIAYLPPFAGITAHEQRMSGAIRRRRIGEGVAGAVLRNLLLDMQQVNTAKRAALRAGKSKISDADLKRLREEDPWELLLKTLREVFSAELIVDDFREEYHSYINVHVVKGEVDGYKLKRHAGYNQRDLMVEGSGFLQWLSVYTLATSTSFDVLLFDEPDAHLHPTLQGQLLSHLDSLAIATGKQVLLATHSSEILKGADPERILQIRSNGSSKYLTENHQKVGLLVGLGADYSPRIDSIRRTKRMLFIEGSSDLTVLRGVCKTLGYTWPENWIEWQTTASHKERRNLWTALREELGDVKAFSLRDRDDDPLGTVGADLRDTGESFSDGFFPRKWRRRYIESYLIWPPTLAKCSGKSEEEVRKVLQEDHGIAVGGTFKVSEAPQALLDVRAKDVLKSFGLNVADVAKELPPDAICDDLRMIVEQLIDLAK